MFIFYMDFETITKNRKSVRKFSVKVPDWRKIVRAIDIAILAPAAGNQGALKYILVNDPDKISEIAKATQQSFTEKVHYMIVIVSNPLKLERSYGNRAYRYMAQESGAAIENFLLALTNQKLATSWVGYFYEKQIKSVLDIPEDLIVEGIFPIGIEARSSRAKQKMKPELDTVLYFNKFKNKKMVPQTRVRSDWS